MKGGEGGPGIFAIRVRTNPKTAFSRVGNGRDGGIESRGGSESSTAALFGRERGGWRGRIDIKIRNLWDPVEAQASASVSSWDQVTF